MARDSDSYVRAVREVAGLIQILIYRREGHPIKDRNEVETDIKARLQELPNYAGDGKPRWRKGLLELAAYAIFAAVSDE